VTESNLQNLNIALSQCSLCPLWLNLPDQFERPFDWPGEYSFFSNLDDRPLDQIRISDHCRDHIRIRRIVSKSCRRCTSREFDRPNAGLSDKCR